MTSVDKSTRLKCGDGTSYCAEAHVGNYETNLRSDPCAVDATSDFNTRYSDEFILWVPKYRKKTCEGNGYLNCSTDTDRFGPRQVTQESFLQGRGQVTSNPSCGATQIKYLPEGEFERKEKSKQTNMSLFAQPTVVPRSCGTITEVDMQRRLDRMPGGWQGSWSPLSGMQFTDPSADPRIPNVASRGRTVTLGTKNKYPDWDLLAKQSEAYTQ